MTEIPEHLLKRAKQRRAELSGEGGDGGGDESSAAAPVPAASTPAPAAPAAVTPAEVVEAPPAPPPPHVQAAMTRRRIPYWVMPVLLFLPVWAYMFQGTLEAPTDAADPLALGASLYTENGCDGCHGATGGGGIGPAFANGAIYETFPDWRDHYRWIHLGSSDWPDATYGANEKPVSGGMPGFSSLSEADLLLIVNYERHVLGGEAPEDVPDGSLIALSEAAAADQEAGYSVLVEQAIIIADADPDLDVAEEDFTVEGEGAPEAG